MILIQNLSKMIKLSYWKSLLEFSGDTIVNRSERSLFCVFLGNYKESLLFESRVFLIAADLKPNTAVKFQIFLPLGIIKGEGVLKEQMFIEDPIYGKVKRLVVQPSQTIVTQKRNYKRYFLLEKAIYLAKDVSVSVMVKDLSMTGVGLSSQERLIASESDIGRYPGLHLRFNDFDKMFTIKKVYEFTDFNFFEYGFSFAGLESEERNFLKKKLLFYHRKLTNFGVSH